VSEGELVRGEWHQPSAILNHFAQGDILLTEPILAIVGAMAGGSDIDRALQQSMAKKRLWDVAGGIAVSPLRTETLPPATHTNCYVVGSEELVVVDPASPYPDEQEALSEALDERVAQGQKIVAVWLTHHHGDHVGAAEFVSERYQAPICAHPLSAAKLEGICRVDEQLQEGQRLRLRGPLERELECVFTPGHAPGHLCFLERETGAMMVGDMLASVGTILIDPSEGDMREYLQSLRRIRERRPRQLLPAHGIAMAHPDQSIDHYLDHRLMRESKVLEALTNEAQSLAELVIQVYSDTPPVLHALAQRSLLAHLLKLEVEGRAGKDATGWRGL
jgi:glyoxylase-like metal-dependent hydrolase (beta-lactamase superfamily II)